MRKSFAIGSSALWILSLLLLARSPSLWGENTPEGRSKGRPEEGVAPIPARIRPAPLATAVPEGLGEELPPGARLIEPASRHSALPPPDSEQQKYDEIAALRARRGSVLEGTLLEGVPETDLGAAEPQGFAAALREVATEDGDRCEREYRTALRKEQLPAARSLSDPPDRPRGSAQRGSAQLVRQLRQWDRRLQRQANRWEQDGEFDAADRLRTLAQQIRQEARTWRIGD